MKRTGGELVVQALEDEGVPFSFGIPGTHNIELYDALAESDSVRPVLVTDEQSASFMADGVWRASGRLACVNLVPGAGLTHALSGIAEAFLDNVPLLVLACGIRRDTGKAYQLHDVDQAALAAPVTKAQLRVSEADDLYASIRRACRLARRPPGGPVLVEVPVNLYLFRHPAATRFEDPVVPLPVPSERDLHRAASLLEAARRPLLYLGRGAGAAGANLVTLAETLESPVATSFQGKGVFPESHPLFLWPGFGDAAPPFARRAAAACDATLALGCRFGEVATGSYGLSPPGPLIHVDVDPAVPGRNYPTALGVTADAAAFVSGLLPRLRRRASDHDLREALSRGHQAVLAEARRAPDRGVGPGRLLAAVQERFGPDTIVTTDSGNGTFLAVELLRFDRPDQLLAPVDYSCMGYAVPAAIGARLARPETPVVALAGDGAFLMTGLELLTAATLGVGVVVLVLRDGELAQIAQFQGTAFGRKTCSVLPDYDLEPLCRGLGVEFLRLPGEEGLEGILREAQRVTAAGGPVVVDVAVDYSRRTHFTKGVVRTNLLRLPWADRLRFLGRALGRKLGRAVSR